MGGRKQRDSERFRPAFRKLGEKIAKLRRDRRLTQARLAEECGLSPTAISDIERADSFPEVHSLFLIARALGETASSLFDGLDVYVLPPTEFPKDDHESDDESDDES